MIYRIALVESGRVTHSWHYKCLPDAMRQFRFLCQVYEEVNEVTPMFTKCTPDESCMRFKDLINTIIYD